jgi:MOSC domain-containing protein YiiM
MTHVFEGAVAGIWVAPAEGAPMEAREQVCAIAGTGIDGDRYAIEAGKYSGTRLDDAQRAVTLIEREAIEGARAEYGVELGEHETRRNLVTTGVALNHLVGREFMVGAVRLKGVDLSEPCTYLEGLTRDGVRRSLVHRGGLRAEILTDGDIRVGDRIVPVT